MDKEKMPLKTFWEAVEQRLVGCSLVNDTRNRFPRHRAFQAELQAVL